MHRSKVETAVIGNEFSVRLGPGSIHDLDAEVAPGLTLRDVTDPDWFEPVEEHE